jgi:hypothetical protein
VAEVYERPYGLTYWKTGLADGLEPLVQVATHQTERVVGFTLPGFAPESGEARPEAPQELVLMVNRLVDERYIARGWANAARLEWFGEGDPRAYEWHFDSQFAAPDTYILHLTLTSAGWLDVHKTQGLEENFLCQAGSVIRFPANLEHRHSWTLDPTERRHLLVVGHDPALVRESG